MVSRKCFGPRAFRKGHPRQPDPRLAGRSGAVAKFSTYATSLCPLPPNCRHSVLTYSSAMRIGRLLQVVFALTALAACGSARTTLSPCWRAVDLQQGERFRGMVLISAGYDQRPMIFPIACDGGVTADLPDSVVLPSHKGADSRVSPERLFYQARVEGEVTGTAFGRPSVRLEHVSDPRQMLPSWSRRKLR
jgi:hypothetical protein